MPIKVQEVYVTPNGLDQKTNSSQYMIIKAQIFQIRERVLKASWKPGMVAHAYNPSTWEAEAG